MTCYHCFNKQGLVIAWLSGIKSLPKNQLSGTGRTIIKKPFTLPQELVAGYWLGQVNSIEEAPLAVSAKQRDWVKRCPNPMPGDSEIEICPVFEAEDFGKPLTSKLRKQEDRIRPRLKHDSKSNSSTVTQMMFRRELLITHGDLR